MSDIKDFVTVGNYTAIAGGVTFHGEDNHPWVANNKLVASYPFGERYNFNYPRSSGKGEIIIGSDVWIGECARILSGVHIGDGAIIGADAVVTKDVGPYEVWAGNPAKLIKLRYDYPIVQKLMKIQWWNWNTETISQRIDDFHDIGKFVRKYEKTK